MRIFEAYDDTSVRLHFKEYLEAEGMSMSLRERTYTRFGTYMSRIRGVLYDRMLLGAIDEADFKAKLEYIFYDKWKDHLGYPEMPDYFFRYLDFLHTISAARDIPIDGLSPEDDCRITDGKLTRYEERFLTPDGKLRLLANPLLIRSLRNSGNWRDPVNDEAVQLCADFYAGTPVSMTGDEWKASIEKWVRPQKKSGKRGDLSISIKRENGETSVCNSYQAMEMIVQTAGMEKALTCNLRLNGQPIVTRRVPQGKEATFKDMGNGHFLNNMGAVIDRFKVMKVLVSMWRLPFEISLSKETAVKSKRGPRKSKSEKETSAATPKRVLQPTDATHTHHPSVAEAAADTASTGLSEVAEADFCYGKDGVLNLFGDYSSSRK